MPIVPWQCALGDAPAATFPAATTVEIAPPDDSIDTNKIVITGTGTISSFGASAPLVTKDVTFVPSGGPITLVNSAQLTLLGGTRTIGAKSFGRYASDGAGHWQEIAYFAVASVGAAATTVYATVGSQTITIPSSSAKIRLSGGGGSARGAGSCGAGGGYLEKFLSGLTTGLTLALVVGAGGNPFGPFDGGATTLSSGTQSIATLTANGGAGRISAGTGGSVYNMTAGLGGTAIGGDVNIQGGNCFGWAVSVGTSGQWGVFGLSGSNPLSAQAANSAGHLYGGGASSDGPNLNGGQGVCLIDWF
jgi:hypothetical protein